MVVGQIGYHNQKNVKYITVKKNHDIVKKIDKTKSEDMKPDLFAEREKRDRDVLTAEKDKARKEAEEIKIFKLVGTQNLLVTIVSFLRRSGDCG